MHSILLKEVVSNVRKCWPMNIAREDRTTGFRIGGLPPEAAKPSFVSAQTHYFGTFPITGEREEELSIFYSLNYLDVNDPAIITRNINRPLGRTQESLNVFFMNRPRVRKVQTLRLNWMVMESKSENRLSKTLNSLRLELLTRLEVFRTFNIIRTPFKMRLKCFCSRATFI